MKSYTKLAVIRAKLSEKRKSPVGKLMPGSYNVAAAQDVASAHNVVPRCTIARADRCQACMYVLKNIYRRMRRG